MNNKDERKQSETSATCGSKSDLSAGLSAHAEAVAKALIAVRLDSIGWYGLQPETRDLVAEAIRLTGADRLLGG